MLEVLTIAVVLKRGNLAIIVVVTNTYRTYTGTAITMTSLFDRMLDSPRSERSRTSRPERAAGGSEQGQDAEAGADMEHLLLDAATRNNV